MTRFLSAVFLLACTTIPAAANDVAPGGTLRAVYLGSNPAQAVQDRATGEIRGASADLVRELGRSLGVPVELKPIAGPPAVIDAVKNGQADIGFVAYEATRRRHGGVLADLHAGAAELPGAHDSPIKAIADVDRAGQKIAGTRNDSITLCLKRILKQATPVELDNEPGALIRALAAKEIDALAPTGSG